MPPRYTVRLQPDNRHYCVWDNERRRIAKSAEDRDCIDLALEDAFDTAQDLNKKKE